MKVLKRIMTFLIFILFFCALSSGPINFFKSRCRKYSSQNEYNLHENDSQCVGIDSDKKFIEFYKSQFETNERAAFYYFIIECCRSEYLMLDIKAFYLEENEFVQELVTIIPVMNKAIMLLVDAQSSRDLSKLTESFNYRLRYFFEEKRKRYFELSNLINEYHKNGEEQLHNLILTKYDLLREKQTNMILCWKSFCEFFIFSVGFVILLGKKDFWGT